MMNRLPSILTRGITHQQRLDDIDTRIVVSGSRGKSKTVERLYEIFAARNTDVYAKVTGDKPQSLYAGETNKIERSDRVVLYENEREIRRYAPEDVLIVENQGISEYTTRLVNQQFARADVVMVTNIRQDHRDTLGRTRGEIARSFARSIPAGTHLVNCEQEPELRRRLAVELRGRDVSLSHVSVPEEYADVPAAESIFGLNEVLQSVGSEPVSDGVLHRFLDEMRVEWVRLPAGKVFNAADVNDVESTEIIRRDLCTGPIESIVPLIYLRDDRRARTASFLTYLDELHDSGVVDTVHAVGTPAPLFARKASFPVTVHTDAPPEDVLDATLEEGPPVLLMGNTVAEFMRGLDDEISARRVGADTVHSNYVHGEEVGQTNRQLTTADD
ncbi:Mur ligase [Halobacterium sp. R2-5]|uniref:Mur ligase n=1 Tax=Halobacterium sp. R2-5 TaxID=2715751 RepID=UPI001421BC1C|nr:Mur ligase [Halobacterium sp. R2-5]NIC01010.1 Mur ligase [Halobacterium sp. R2-5]